MKILVIHSGGQDSTTCLALAKTMVTEKIASLTFNYGQRQDRELEAAKRSSKGFSVDHVVIDMQAFGQVAKSGLTTDTQEAIGTQNHSRFGELPASFVPARNAMFLTMAYAYAVSNDFDTIMIGTNQHDYSGYPDCREEFLISMETSLYLSCLKKVKILRPLQNMRKKDIWKTADQLGLLEVIKTDTYTCYNNAARMNEWGYGCGECPACKLRKNSYFEYKQEATKQKLGAQIKGAENGIRS